MTPGRQPTPPTLQSARRIPPILRSISACIINLARSWDVSNRKLTGTYKHTERKQAEAFKFNRNHPRHKTLSVCLRGVPSRLLEELLQKEKEYQQVLKATLQQRTHDLELVKVRHRPPGKHTQTGICWMCTV